MYGYEPPRQTTPGCRDTLTLIRVAFEVLAPIVGIGIGALGYVALTFYLFSLHVALGLIPIAGIAGGLVFLARRDRRLQAEREREARWGD